MVFHTEVNGSFFLLKVESREGGACSVQPCGFVQIILRITGSLRLRGGRKPDSVVVRDRTWRQKLGLLCLNDHGIFFYQEQRQHLGFCLCQVHTGGCEGQECQSSEGATLTQADSRSPCTQVVEPHPDNEGVCSQLLGSRLWFPGERMGISAHLRLVGCRVCRAICDAQSQES